MVPGTTGSLPDVITSSPSVYTTGCCCCFAHCCPRIMTDDRPTADRYTYTQQSCRQGISLQIELFFMYEKNVFPISAVFFVLV